MMGGGSWATALAKLLLTNCREIIWYMRRDDRIADFLRDGHNPVYLSDVMFDTNRIRFSSDINAVCSEADTLLLAMPSPYIKEHLKKITVDLSGKCIVSAVKGIVPDENAIVTDYMGDFYHIRPEHQLVIGGPCHAEEVAMEHLSYLTVACQNQPIAENMASYLNGPYIRCKLSRDVIGVEYAAVLKNIYAVAAGIAHGLNYGDNFQAVLMSNAIREMDNFMSVVYPMEGRNIMDSAYLGDLLVTGYSYFSRNRMFGTMIGKGYTVKSAMLEMNMVAEGYYATYGVMQLIQQHDIRMPIVEAVYAILYQGKDRRDEFKKLTAYLD